MEDVNENFDYQYNSYQGQNEIEDDSDSPVLIPARPQNLQRPRQMVPGKTYRTQLLYNSEMPDCYRSDTMAPHGGSRQGRNSSYREDSLMMVESEPPFRANRSDTDYPAEENPTSLSRGTDHHHRRHPDTAQHFQPTYPNQAQSQPKHRPPTLNSGHPLDQQSQTKHHSQHPLNSHRGDSNVPPRSYPETPDEYSSSRIYPKFLEQIPPSYSSDLQTYSATNTDARIPDRESYDFGGNDSARRTDFNFGNGSNFGTNMSGPSGMGPLRGGMGHHSDVMGHESGAMGHDSGAMGRNSGAMGYHSDVMGHNIDDFGPADSGLGSNRVLQGTSASGRNRNDLPERSQGGQSRVGLVGPPDSGLLGQRGSMEEARAVGQTMLSEQSRMMVNFHRNQGDAYNTRDDAQIRHPSDHGPHRMAPIPRGGPNSSNHQGNATIQGNRPNNTRFPTGNQEANVRFTNNQSHEARFRFPQNNRVTSFPNQPGNSSFPNKPGNSSFSNQLGNSSFPNQPGNCGFPNQPGNCSFPNQPGNSSFPNQSGNSSFSNQPGNSSFPNQPGSSRFPNQQAIASSKLGEESGPPAAKRPRLLPLPKNLEDKTANCKKDVKDDRSECTDLKVMVTHVDLASIWYHNMRVAHLRSSQFMLQVVGRLESVRVKPHHKTIIIRHPSQHTALQCIFYEIDRKFPPIVIGSIIIVSGHMIGEKMMKIFDVEQIYESEIQKLHRLVFLSERQIKDIFDSRTGDGKSKI